MVDGDDGYGNGSDVGDERGMIGLMVVMVVILVMRGV